MTAKPTFSEAIKVRDGAFFNLPLHEARMNRTAGHFFGSALSRKLNLVPETIPAEFRTGLVKCRVVYSAEGIESVEFTPYTFRHIATTALVHDNAIDYTYKSTDRSRLNELLKSSGCDEIVIVKNGLVTDSSAANIVIQTASGALYTPKSPLLRGTKREQLLRAGVIAERDIRPEELLAAAKIRLINALIDLGDQITIDTLRASAPARDCKPAAGS